MVQTNPLCRLDKSNDARERRVEAVSRRWDRILDKLDILQQRVNIAAMTHGVTMSRTAVSADNNVNIAIHAPVSKPPYCLQLLTALCPEALVFFSTHLHSSVSSSSRSLVLNTHDKSRTECSLKITLIYKDIKQLTTFITPSKGVQGEVTLLRYLARLYRSELYEDSGHVAAIDEMLDSLGAAEGKHAVTKLLGCALDKTEWLAGDKFSLADVAGLSLAHGHNIATPSVTKWIKRCQQKGYSL